MLYGFDLYQCLRDLQERKVLIEDIALIFTSWPNTLTFEGVCEKLENQGFDFVSIYPGFTINGTDLLSLLWPKIKQNFIRSWRGYSTDCFDGNPWIRAPDFLSALMLFYELEFTYNQRRNNFMSQLDYEFLKQKFLMESQMLSSSEFFTVDWHVIKRAYDHVSKSPHLLIPPLTLVKQEYPVHESDWVKIAPKIEEHLNKAIKIYLRDGYALLTYPAWLSSLVSEQYWELVDRELLRANWTREKKGFDEPYYILKPLKL